MRTFFAPVRLPDSATTVLLETIYARPKCLHESLPAACLSAVASGHAAIGIIAFRKRPHHETSFRTGNVFTRRKYPTWLLTHPVGTEQHEQSQCCEMDSFHGKVVTYCPDGVSYSLELPVDLHPLPSWIFPTSRPNSKALEKDVRVGN